MKTGKEKPPIREWWHYDKNEIRSVDGSVIFRYNSLRWQTEHAMTTAMQELVKDDGHGDDGSIILEGKIHRRAKWLTQIPYHDDMLPHYEYCAEGIQKCWTKGKNKNKDLEKVTVANLYLPPGWLAEKMLPIIQNLGDRALKQTRAVKGIASLTLSNCSLSPKDLTSVTSFLDKNVTLRALDISKSNIESVDTVKDLANAIQQHPTLIHINLSYCSLGGGDTAALNMLLTACKECVSLDIGHKDFSKEGVALVAKFVGNKNALTSFTLTGAQIDKDNKKLLAKSLVKNKTIERFGLHSNGIKMPAVLSGTKKTAESQSRLTHLDLSSNSFPIQGANAMVKFLESADSGLISLNLSQNNMKNKSAELLLPAIKEHTSLKHLDFSGNWLKDSIAHTVIAFLKDNSDLLTFDLSKNASLKLHRASRWDIIRRERIPAKDRGEASIVKGILFDMTSLQTIASSNHTCDVKVTGSNLIEVQNETIRMINALDASEGKKIRLKVLLAMNRMKTELYDPRSFRDVPLELVPQLLEMVQQDIKYTKSEVQVIPKKKKQTHHYWRQNQDEDSNFPLNCIYEIIMAYNTPLLFARGAGALKAKKRKATEKPQRRKRRKFGDADDDDDHEPWIPSGYRKTSRLVRNSETGKWEYISPMVV